MAAACVLFSRARREKMGTIAHPPNEDLPNETFVERAPVAGMRLPVSTQGEGSSGKGVRDKSGRYKVIEAEQLHLCPLQGGAG